MVHRLLAIGIVNTDKEELKLQKTSLIMIPLLIGPAAFLWGLIYIYYQHYISASIPLFYATVSVLNLCHMSRTKNIALLQKTQMLLVLVLPFFLMWSLGGFALGSFVFIWAFYAPIASLIYEEGTKSLYWFYAFLGLICLSIFLDPMLKMNYTSHMPKGAVTLFYFLNISAGLAGIYFLIRYFIGQKDKNANDTLQREHDNLLDTTKKLKEANDKLNHLANYDYLTNLPNRYLFRKSLNKMISLAKRQNHSVAILYLDLDGFKVINDSYGHAIGDEVLKTVAKRVKVLLREEDIVARIGGDEFAVAIGNLTDKAFVEQISQRILHEVSQSYKKVASVDTISGSIGVSFFPQDASDIDTLINNADKTMYSVKASGKNAYKIYK